MQHMVKDVAEFHKAFGAFTSDAPAFPSDERIALRRSLVAEKHSEFWRGVAAWDMVEAADDVTDLLYVLVGTGLEFGLPINIHSKYGHSAKLPQFPAEDELAVRKQEHVNTMRYFWDYVAKRDLDMTEFSLSNLVNRSIFTAREFYIPLELCWAEVHRANMSKLNHPHRDCLIAPNIPCNCGAVKYREDGKVLKGEGYRAPDIEGIMRAAGWTPIKEQQPVAPYDPHRS